jgi:hypothetical protein
MALHTGEPRQAMDRVMFRPPGPLKALGAIRTVRVYLDEREVEFVQWARRDNKADEIAAHTGISRQAAREKWQEWMQSNDTEGELARSFDAVRNGTRIPSIVRVSRKDANVSNQDLQAQEGLVGVAQDCAPYRPTGSPVQAQLELHGDSGRAPDGQDR